MKEEDIRKRAVFNRYLELLAQDAAPLVEDQSRFVTIECPACACMDLDKAFMKGGFNYDICRSCETLFVNPRPPFSDLLRFYKDSPSAHYWVNDFFKPVAEARRKLIFKPRVDFVTGLFRNQDFKVIGDIGAGFGIFLEELKKDWPDKRLIAVEPSSEMAAICRGKGLEVIEHAVEDASGLSGTFDLLTSFELFEHLFAPGIFLEKACGLLKPNGYLLLTTLSGTGFDIQVLGKQSKSVLPPQHLNFFNPLSIEILLKKSGFEVIEITTPGNLDWDIVEGMILNEDAKPGRFWEMLALKGTSRAKKEFQYWIANNNMSSHLRVVAKRSMV